MGAARAGGSGSSSSGGGRCVVLVALVAFALSVLPGTQAQEFIAKAIYKGCDWPQAHYDEADILRGGFFNVGGLPLSHYITNCNFARQVDVRKLTYYRYVINALQYTVALPGDDDPNADGPTGDSISAGIEAALFAMRTKILLACGNTDVDDYIDVLPFGLSNVVGIGVKLYRFKKARDAAKALQATARVASKVPVAPIKVVGRLISQTAKFVEDKIDDVFNGVDNSCPKGSKAVRTFKKVDDTIQKLQLALGLIDSFVMPVVARSVCDENLELFKFLSVARSFSVAPLRYVRALNPDGGGCYPYNATVQNSGRVTGPAAGGGKRRLLSASSDAAQRSGYEPYTPVGGDNPDMDAVVQALGRIADAFIEFKSFTDGVAQRVNMLSAWLDEAGNAIGSVLDPLAPVISVFESIGGIFAKLECPKWLSWLCNLDDLLEELIDGLLKLLKLPPVQVWIERLLDELGLEGALAKLNPGVRLAVFDDLAQFEPKFDAFQAKIDAELKGTIGPLLSGPSPFRKPVQEVFEVVPGKLYQRNVRAYDGAPVTVDCSAYSSGSFQSYAFTVRAERTIEDCTQDLAPLIRFPCASDGATSDKCVVDYNGDFPTSCSNVLRATQQNPAALATAFSALGITRLPPTDVLALNYYCVASPSFKLDSLAELLKATGIDYGQLRLFVERLSNTAPIDPEGLLTNRRTASAGGSDDPYVAEPLPPAYDWNPSKVNTHPSNDGPLHPWAPKLQVESAGGVYTQLSKLDCGTRLIKIERESYDVPCQPGPVVAGSVQDNYCTKKAAVNVTFEPCMSTSWLAAPVSGVTDDDASRKLKQELCFRVLADTLGTFKYNGRDYQYSSVRENLNAASQPRLDVLNEAFSFPFEQPAAGAPVPLLSPITVPLERRGIALSDWECAGAGLYFAVWTATQELCNTTFWNPTGQPGCSAPGFKAGDSACHDLTLVFPTLDDCIGFFGPFATSVLAGQAGLKATADANGNAQSGIVCNNPYKGSVAQPMQASSSQKLYVQCVAASSRLVKKWCESDFDAGEARPDQYGGNPSLADVRMPSLSFRSYLPDLTNFDYSPEAFYFPYARPNTAKKGVTGVSTRAGNYPRLASLQSDRDPPGTWLLGFEGYPGYWPPARFMLPFFSGVDWGRPIARFKDNKRWRRLVLADYRANKQVAAPPNGGLRGECEGKHTCKPGDILPTQIEYACVEPQVFATSTPIRIEYCFGDSAAWDRRKTVQCPGGSLASLEAASFGQGLDLRDVTATLQPLCRGDRTRCAFKVGDAVAGGAATQAAVKNKVLRVRVLCTCAAPSMPGLQPDDSCAPCMAGKYRNATMTDCEPCPAGTSSGPGALACTPCAPGSFSAAPGRGACTPCPAGTFGSVAGATDVTAACVPCANETYAPEANSTACLACPLGTSTFGVPAPTLCAACPLGYVRGAGEIGCKPCGPGTFISPNVTADVCALCPPGTASAALNNQQCVACAVGFYQPAEGSSSCKLCPDDKRTDGTGATSVNDCFAVPEFDWEAASKQFVATARRRSLLQASGGGGGYNASVCAAFLAQFPGAGRTEEARLGQLGNGYCNRGPWNTRLCNWDGGDCCITTCIKANLTDADNVTTPWPASCAQYTFACKDPSQANRTLKGCAALRSEEQGTPEPANATCNAASSRRNNSLCDDDLNIAACGYDGGDCCAKTCVKREGVFGACLITDCRDPAVINAPFVDTTPPRLVDVPADVTIITNNTLYALAIQAPTVVSTDNDPCHNGSARLVLDQRVAGANSSVLFVQVRRWQATDPSGNAVTAQQAITVIDDGASRPLLQGVPAARVTAECNAVPVMANVRATAYGAPTPLTYRERRTNGSCPGRYTLQRTWSATNEAGRSTNFTQTISVVDTLPPAPNASAANRTICVLALLLPRSVVFTGVSRDARFAFSSANVRDACSGTPTRGSFVSVVSDLPTVDGRIASYAARTDSLTVPTSLAKGPSNTRVTAVWRVSWRVADGCGVSGTITQRINVSTRC